MRIGTNVLSMNG
ncbi:Protein of unknown function [Bacillus mycoides]|uniref:Uncharacterized protein n=1 Tax=Bacillus mycoides TaxID=1405 RepID=A0A1G4EN09_BACMY|nr:Protein of unknown function [Bacillus mycoides]